MNDITLYDYWTILKRRKATVVATALVVLALTGVYLKVTPRVYESDVTLLFPKESSTGLGMQLAQATGIQISNAGEGFSGRNVFTAVLESRTISKSVFHRLRMEKYNIKPAELRKNLAVNLTKEGQLSVACNVPTSWLKGHVPGDALAEKTAELSADLANAYVAELEDYDRSNDLFMNRKNRLYIEEQLGITRKTLSKDEMRLEAFQSRHPDLVPPDKGSIYAEQIVNLSSEATEADIEFKEAQRRASAVRAIWDTGAPSGVSPDALIDNPTIAELRSQLAQLEVKHATLLQEFTENHPEVVGTAQEIEQLKVRIHKEVERVVNGQSSSVDPARQEILRQLVLADVNRDSLAARRKAFTDSIQNLEHRASGVPLLQVEYVRLQRQLKSAETIYTTLLSEDAKAKVEEGHDADSFIVLDSADVPQSPSRPRVKITLFAALVAGILLGVMIASLQGTGKPPSK